MDLRLEKELSGQTYDDHELVCCCSQLMRGETLEGKFDRNRREASQG